MKAAVSPWSTAGWGEIARRTAFDIHPPFYYWLLKGWVSLFGTGEIGFALTVGGVGGWRGLFWCGGWGITSLTAGLAPLPPLWRPFLPLLVYYSQETRMYMLLSFLGCLTVWLAARLLAEPLKGWLAVAYILTDHRRAVHPLRLSGDAGCG
jgi:mannosyltransferase